MEANDTQDFSAGGKAVAGKNNKNNNGKGPNPNAQHFRPTLKDIQNDSVATLAENWSANNANVELDAALIESIYNAELIKTNFSLSKLSLLEISQYLERYLWPFFEDESPTTHILSIVLMVNEKRRTRVEAWGCFEKSPEKFPLFFSKVLHLCIEDSPEITLQIKRFLLIFMINCFQSLENALVRSECMGLVALSTWHGLASVGKREAEFSEFPQLAKFWKFLEKKFVAADDDQKEKLVFERSWFTEMVKDFMSILDSLDESTEDVERIKYCERFMEFLIDLEAQLPTRRYINTLVQDHQVVAFCKLSTLAKSQTLGNLFSQLLEIFAFYTGFEINGHTGLALTKEEMIDIRSSKLAKLQRVAFSEFRDELLDLALTNLATIEDRASLSKHFEPLNNERLVELCHHLHIRTTKLTDPTEQQDRLLIMESLLLEFEQRHSQIERINALPLYPNEVTLFEDAAVKEEIYDTDRPLALPKLNLQFLTLHDYLLRNFDLFRLESNYEIRQDIEDAVQRLAPRIGQVEGTTFFSGWSRVAAPVSYFNMVTVGEPNLGEDKPSKVVADVTLNVRKYTEAIQAEWENIREHDILFLLTIEAHENIDEAYDPKSSFRKHYGLKHVRGCEVLSVIGPNGKPFDPKKDPQLIQEHRSGNTRTFRVAMDPNQYKVDQDTMRREGGKADIYQSFNVVLRRKPQENNFKPVLETIRDLMQSDLMVPEWLHNVFLGYGNPDSAHYAQMPDQTKEIDFRDTFLDLEHLKASFPGMKIVPKEGLALEDLAAPYVVKFPDASEQAAPTTSKKRKAGSEKKKKGAAAATVANGEPAGQAQDELVVSTYSTPNMGPYPENVPKTNQIRFTPTQVEAIKAGTNPGLTLVVGPPGTGKTDVAVQIIANLYNNFPNQHTLLVTHSNQALNQLFEKIIALNVDERHLLRLGHGEEELNTELSFSKYGRVTSFLEKRMELLAEVDRLAYSLSIGGEHGATCETAGYFFSYHIRPLWEKYDKTVLKSEDTTMAQVQEKFPFGYFFQNAPEPLFGNVGEDIEAAKEVSRGCFRHLEKVFQKLEEISAFELLSSSYDRANYLLTKEAKIIAMTCTHAALKRRELVKLGFKYDNVVMEEAAQILEVETFIPMLLQEPEGSLEANRLKRVILIGDHNQLPPVVKNTSFQQYGNMEQSMFTRFVRLGVPSIELDAQGRARSEMADLYKWRYQQLGDLPNIQERLEFQYANPGFLYDFQFINVDNYKGQGESAPRPHFLQNLGEAEYVVATYQYMRLLGYPAEKISILTTYNGQKDLIRDVLKQRCGWNPIFGQPARITTVDKYQGQQNDYILLSLVRTKAVGHLRDVRRLIVALSRARLGLYIFGRQKLFENCHELEPAFQRLVKRPTELWLKTGEMYPNQTRLVGDVATGEESDAEEEEVKEEGKGKGKGSKGKKSAKKTVKKEEKESASSSSKSTGKAYSIKGVEQFGEFVYQMMKEQQQYAIQQQQQMAMEAAFQYEQANLPPPVTQQENEENQEREDEDTDAVMEETKTEETTTMEVDA